MAEVVVEVAVEALSPDTEQQAHQDKVMLVETLTLTIVHHVMDAVVEVAVPVLVGIQRDIPTRGLGAPVLIVPYLVHQYLMVEVAEALVITEARLQQGVVEAVAVALVEGQTKTVLQVRQILAAAVVVVLAEALEIMVLRAARASSLSVILIPNIIIIWIKKHSFLSIPAICFPIFLPKSVRSYG
ncbi:MAG: hypothetical protein NTY06_02195 [Candidatus Gottesmanbacteria bacterium]|nr:hypothetical protein [Candidatus Gottesmanbacteria bacterium]